MKIRQNSLKELIARLQKCVDKVNGSQMVNKGFKDRVDQANLNTMKHYQEAIAEFGGGQNVYRIKYTYKVGLEGVWISFYEYYQADNTEEAKAACILHNLDKEDFTITGIDEIKLRTRNKLGLH